MTSCDTNSWNQINMCEMHMGLTIDDLEEIIDHLSNGTIFRLSNLSRANKKVTIRFQTRPRETKCRTKSEFWVTNTTRKRLLSKIKTMDLLKNKVTIDYLLKNNVIIDLLDKTT
ncbi:MAG: hypothetical protein WD512_20495 [Candidatus Paceibacterota bacterium]